MNKIQNIVFDLGNVLLNFRPNRFMSQYYGDNQKIKSFTSKIIGKELWLKMDKGVLSLLEAEELLYKKFPEDKKILDWFFDNWMKMLSPIEENINLLKSLKQKGYCLYFLSNFIKEAYIYVESKYDFFKNFSGGILSCYVHHLKPEPEIYKALIDKYEIKPEESIFIDDHIDFLKKAKEFGFETIHYQTSTKLKNELKNFNIFL